MHARRKITGTRQTGFSTAELLVATAVGLFLVAGVLGVFVTNKGVFTNTTRASELQENGRFALEYLLTDLRHAYFFGGKHFDGFAPDTDPGTPKNSDVTNNCSGADAVYNFNARATPAAFPVHGATATTNDAIGCISDALVVNGIPSDILILKLARPTPLYATSDLIQGNVYIASNRNDGVLRLFTAATTMPAVAPTCTGRTEICLPHGAYWPYRFAAYYIRGIPNGTEPPALARMTLEWNNATGMSVVSEDLVDGVEGMRILYGVSNNDAPETFHAAGAVADWDDVVAVQIHLLVRTTRPDRSYVDKRTYRMGDVRVTATQTHTLSQQAELRNFHRIVISTTVNLRNKSLVRD